MTAMINWNWSTFNELSLQKLYDILALRQHVFILEQESFFADIDNLDQVALHLLGHEENQLVAYVRLLLPPHTDSNRASFGRVACPLTARNRGLGKQIIQKTLDYLAQHHPTLPIVISAQTYLESFYKTFGFRTLGEPYLDCGVAHIDMIRE